MKILTICQASVAFALISSAASGADTPAAGDTDTGQVLNQLHQSNQSEILMGKLAAGHGQSKEVKSFGKTLVNDHTAADKKVAALATEEKIALTEAQPPTDEMQNLPEGAGFDMKFAEMMLDAHKKAVDETTQARDTTTDKKLKKLLNQIIPMLQKHEQMAQKIIDSQQKNASR